MKFEIGDLVRVKPRGHKMVVTFVYTPYGEGLWEGIYKSMKLQYPNADFYYTCANPKTGKSFSRVYPEDMLEKVI